MGQRARNAAIGGTVLAVALAGVMVGPSASAQTAKAKGGLQLTNKGSAQAAAQPSATKVRTTSLAYRNAPSAKSLIGAAGLTTIQTWSSSVVAGQNGLTYPFTLVGKDVRVPATNTGIKTQVIPVIFTFTSTGDVYDPTVAYAGCGETQSDLSGTLNGPIFKKTKYSPGGTFIGKVQYTDALQREQFWAWTNPAGANPNYHVNLNPTTPVSLSISANGFPEYLPGTCHALGELDINTWDSYVQATLMPLLAPYGVKPTTFPIFLFKNVVMYDGSVSNCCILGYHSAFNNPSFGNHAQTYSTSEYDTTGDFGAAAQDNTILSHEVAEWANDPFVNNPTPAWGHIGQVSGCQGNLEVGDPLTGTTFAQKAGGITYHLQELAFFGWFFDFNSGVNGWYSTRGTFSSGASLCT